MDTLGRFPVIVPAATSQSGTFVSGAVVLAGNNLTGSAVGSFTAAGLTLGGQLTDSFGGPAMLDVTSGTIVLSAQDMLRIQLGVFVSAGVVLAGQNVGTGSVIPRDAHGDPLPTFVVGVNTGESWVENEDDGLSSTVMVGPSGISYTYGKDTGRSGGSS